MKNFAYKFLSLLIVLPVGFSPIASYAAEGDQAPLQIEFSPPAAIDGGNKITVFTSGEQLELFDIPQEVKEQIAAVELPIGTQEQNALLKPSVLAEALTRGRHISVHFTTQYIYFQAVVGLAALAALAMNYDKDPIALQNNIKTYTSWGRFGESVVGFGFFTGVDFLAKKVLVNALRMKAPNMFIQQIGMGAGLLASTIVGEVWNDKNIQLCGKSLGTELQSCDAAFDTWVVTNRIVQYIPMLVQNTSSALMSAAINNMIRKGYFKSKAILAGAGATAETGAVANVVRQSAIKRWTNGLIIRMSEAGIGGEIASSALEKGIGFVGGLGGQVMGLGSFMVVDALISTPIMKAYTKNYIEEQDSWLSLRKLKDAISKTSIKPLNWLSYYAYMGISSMHPDEFPKIQDENVRANWINNFDIDIFLKFIRLWAKYNVAARNQSGEKSLLNFIWPYHSISKIERDYTVVDTPQSEFEIMRDAHGAVLSSLDYLSEGDFVSTGLWQTYDINYCAKNLSKAAKLNFQQAIQFYVGLSPAQKTCLVNIDIYDNLVAYINLSSQHRGKILGDVTTASAAWTEALNKFLWMYNLSIHTEDNFIKSAFAKKQGKDSFPNAGGEGETKATELTYKGVEAYVRNAESSLNLEVKCPPDKEDCKAVSESADEGFLPQSLWVNDDVGNAHIKNNTDYLIAEMACGPDVNARSSVWLDAKTYDNSVGTVIKGIGSLFGKFYDLLHLDQGEKNYFTKQIAPDSAMIYLPAGLYPRFVPPRIVDGDGKICDHPLRGNNSVQTGRFSDGKNSYNLVDYISSHIKPDIMAPNPKKPGSPSYSLWHAAHIKQVYADAISGFQQSYNNIIEKDLFPVLKGSQFTDGCPSGTKCFQSWREPKVSMRVYESMEVEMRVLLGVLNEIYMYQTELMKKARDLDDQNPIATSYVLREAAKGHANPEALAAFDTRATIFFAELTNTSADELDENGNVKSAAPAKAKPKFKLADANKLAPDYNKLKDFELKFIRSFRSRSAEFSPDDKNGRVSFNVDQAEAALTELENFFTLSRISEINDLQAKTSGLIFRSLESLLQERNTYSNFLLVDSHPTLKGDKPEDLRKEEERFRQPIQPPASKNESK